MGGRSNAPDGFRNRFLNFWKTLSTMGDLKRLRTSPLPFSDLDHSGKGLSQRSSKRGSLIIETRLFQRPADLIGIGFARIEGDGQDTRMIIKPVFDNAFNISESGVDFSVKTTPGAGQDGECRFACLLC